MTDKKEEPMKIYTLKYSIFKKEKSRKKSKDNPTQKEPEQRKQEVVMACDEEEAKYVLLKRKLKGGPKTYIVIDSVSL